MVRWWMPTFLMPFFFQSFFSNSSKNELCGGRGRVHQTLNSKHPLIKSLFSILFLVLVDILSIVLRTCAGTALANMNFGWSILGSYSFYTFLLSFSFHSFLFKNLQDWTLNGKIVDSFFSHPIFLSLFLFKNKQFQLWMVRSWILTFLMPFSFQRFLSNSSRNELWVGRCGGRGRAHHKYTLNFKHPLRKPLFS